MFSLHETTRIRLGRAAFCALCLLPTCAVLAWSIYLRTPDYRRFHERALAALCGERVTLARASSPRPGVLLYESLELADRDTGEVLALLPFVEIDSGGSVVVVRLPFPAMINGARLDALARLAQELARPDRGLRQVRLEAHNLTLRLPDGDQTFTDVAGHLESDVAGAGAQLSFRRATAGQQPAQPCLLLLVRRRDGADVVRTVQLTTGPTPLATSTLAPLCPAVESLGKTCQFAGRMTARHRAGTWTTELAGSFTALDLDALVSHRFPHKLSGMAEVEIDSAVLRDGRVESAAGRLAAGPGVVSRSLVQSAETHLGIRAEPAALDGANNLVSYRRLGIGFQIGPEGMTLRGTVPEIAGALLTDHDSALVYQPPVTAQPVVALVRTLVPQSEVHVPATRETATLTNRLPVPSIVPAPGSEAPLPTARAVNVNPLRGDKTVVR